MKSYFEEAHARFQGRVFPTRRDELWRYFDISRLLSRSLNAAQNTQEHADSVSISESITLACEAADALEGDAGCTRLIFLDGILQETSPFEGFVVEEVGPNEVGVFAHAPDEHAMDEALWINEGARTRGYRISLHKSSEKSLHIIQIVTSPGFLASALDIHIGPDVHVSVINTAFVAHPLAFLHSFFHIVTRASSSLFYMQNQDLCEGACVVTYSRFALEEKSTLNALAFCASEFGHCFNQTLVNLEGSKSAANVFGLANTERRKTHVTNATSIVHSVPECESQTWFKALVGAESDVGFQGEIVVKEGAHNTLALQQAKALLSGDGAHYVAQPKLRIFNDDVVCQHGATCGALDPAALFYLKARALSEKCARKLLTEAFLMDFLERIQFYTPPAMQIPLSRAVLLSK